MLTLHGLRTARIWTVVSAWCRSLSVMLSFGW